jgi:hypothetical protein
LAGIVLKKMEKYGERYLVTKKLALILLVFAIAVCVGVGLVVYYLGVEGGAEGAEGAEPEPAGEPEPEPEPSKDSESPAKKAKVTDVRLPRHLVPVNYKLELVPFIIPDNFSIRGYAEVSVA